ncbi:flagellar hook-length control protein FliK, partial [Nocardioides dubius]|uniref:flagellar hook-length control protein FliK n=1 Tax=Nocardioides dubius TaxID=317019 RepID=UPI0039ECD566
MTVQRVGATGFGPLGAETGQQSAEGAVGFGALLAALVGPQAVASPDGDAVPGGEPTPEGEAALDAEGALAMAGLGAALFAGELARPTPAAPALPGALGDAVAPPTAGSVPPCGTGELVTEAAPADPAAPLPGLLAEPDAGTAAPAPADGVETDPAPVPADAVPAPATEQQATGPGTPETAAPAAPVSGATPADDAPAPSALAPQAIAADPAPLGVVTTGGSTPVASSGSTGSAPLSSAGAQLANPVVTAVAQHLSTGQGTSRMTLTLQPEALGEVRVHLSVRDGAVQVRLSAVDAAAQALALDAPELRRMLEAIGATETRVLVNDSSSGQSHLDQRSTEQQSAFGEREQRPDSPELPWATPTA